MISNRIILIVQIINHIKGGHNLKKFKKIALSLIVLVVLLFTCYSLTTHKTYSSNSHLKKMFYVEGDGDPTYPPPQNNPGNPI